MLRICELFLVVRLGCGGASLKAGVPESLLEHLPLTPLNEIDDLHFRAAFWAA